MELTPRLSKIANLIPEGSVIADVGTDHAYIPVYCFQRGISPKAIAMDLNEGPLKRAHANLAKYGFLDCAELRLSDGLEKLAPGEADVIVIAGMGGLLISEILKNGMDVASDCPLLLLQPMNAPVELRSFLAENGFSVENEYVVREENKFYNIFAVKPGNCEKNTIDLYVGRNLEKNSPDVFKDYMEYKLRICSNIIKGIESSVCPDEEMLSKYRKEAEIYKSFRGDIK